VQPYEPVDPDVELADPRQLAETVPRQWDLLAAISVGGVLGAEARYGLSRAMPRSGTEFPWATLLTNVVGCLLIGVLMVIVLEVMPQRRLVRPFLGVGVLGGFTTFSTFGVEVVGLLREHCPGTAAAYLAASLALCVVATWAAIELTARAVRR